jgi:hypothetical protein
MDMVECLPGIFVPKRRLFLWNDPSRKLPLFDGALLDRVHTVTNCVGHIRFNFALSCFQSCFGFYFADADEWISIEDESSLYAISKSTFLEAPSLSLDMTVKLISNVYL